MIRYQTSIAIPLYLIPFFRYLTSKFLGLTVTFNRQMSSEVNNIFIIHKLIYNFLSNLHWHFFSI